MKLYKDFAKYYDLIYKDKDYEKETKFISSFIKKNADILDVACGTGTHAKYLKKLGHTVTGLDLNENMLKVAKNKVKGVRFITGDMRSFKLNKQFDAITCMFTAINYNHHYLDLIKTLKTFKNHIKDNGVIFFDFPYFTKLDPFFEKLDKDSSILYDYTVDKNTLYITIFWIIKGKVYKDTHKLTLWTERDFKRAFKEVDLKYKLFLDFSLKKKKGFRPIFVAWKNSDINLD